MAQKVNKSISQSLTALSIHRFMNMHNYATLKCQHKVTGLSETKQADNENWTILNLYLNATVAMSACLVSPDLHLVPTY